MNKQWYVVHTYSGYENKVKANLERRIESMNMEDKIFRILVPMEDEVEIKNGKKKISKKKVFPGYVLVEMIMTDDSWYVVRNTPGVTGFVGTGSRPIPLNDDEANNIIKQMGIEEPRSRIDYDQGENIRVTNGPFENFVGVIEEIYPDKGKVKVMVSMFGRETPIELDFTQIEKIS
ncbi:transcription termination/antitermination protein NusG [Desulforamulus aquiferis]|uniref:Transcription termination/antitermination protein NusG n=1 Tax=Desulforamulus aquiferis TaxID=1397668 RepID=A0AAW7ZN43_9FIRM|nr:transcription termination/antitermination protein NusG [Desulforamulus aquiferis]MDO7789165.1 transcription termination/antitermination protein NusG [Desulforamulus aquiferis]